MPADELPPSPEKLLSDIGILQNQAQVLKDQLQAPNEIINQLQNTIQSCQKSNDTYLHPNLGGNTTVLPSNYPKTGGTPIGEPEIKISEPRGETYPEPIGVLQIGSPESTLESFLEYNQYLQPQNKDFSQEEKNRLLEKIQDLENEIQNILNENQDDSDRKVLDEDQKLKLYMNAVHKMLDFIIKNIYGRIINFYNIWFRR